MTLSNNKQQHLDALSTDSGIIAAAAMDQRGSLKKALAAAKGVETAAITTEMIAEFKETVTKALTPHASAILLDPEFGLEASRARSANAGLLLAYEKSGYDNRRPGRVPDLLPHVSVERIADWGADAVKLLLYYTPFEAREINDVKYALVERVGAECEAIGLPFFLEMVGYDETGGDVKGLAYARKKPEVVSSSMVEFSKSRYRVDVLKVEIPVNTMYMEGSVVYTGEKAYSKAEGLEHYRTAAAAASLPFIYLSAGVSNRQFVDSLHLAGEAGADYSGVLCGRATWKDGMPVYAAGGAHALEDWLNTEGVKNITAVNEAIRTAKPWREKFSVN